MFLEAVVLLSAVLPGVTMLTLLWLHQPAQYKLFTRGEATLCRGEISCSYYSLLQGPLVLPKRSFTLREPNHPLWTSQKTFHSRYNRLQGEKGPN